MTLTFSRSVRGLVATLLVLIVRSGIDTHGQQPTTATRPAPASTEAAFLNQYCITCHNERLKTGNLALDTIDVAKVAADAETWEKVVRKIRTGMMPPSGAKRPDRAILDGFATELEARLDRAADPVAPLATPALHRLNRT